MFGLRRRMAGRGLRRWFAGGPSAGGLEPDAMDLPQIGGGRRGKKRKSLGKKPELWDVYVQTKGVEKGLWREIMVSEYAACAIIHSFDTSCVSFFSCTFRSLSLRNNRPMWRTPSTRYWLQIQR